MAFSVNTASVLGRLGADPELRYTSTGKPVCNVRLATTYRRGDTDETEWHDVVAWGKLAELAARLCVKGDRLHVSGRLRTRDYTDAKAVRRWRTEIVASEMVFLGNRAAQSAADERNSPEPF
jgi:single-strand DNA-binding protein